MSTHDLPTYAIQAIIALIAVVLLVMRQLRAKPVKNQHGFLPLILVVLALQPPGPAEASLDGIAVLAASLALSTGMGYWRATTTRVWHDAKGQAWSQGTALTAILWIVTLAGRGMLEFGLAPMIGVETHPGGIWLSLAVTLGVQRAAILFRSRHLTPTAGEAPTIHGAGIR